jgi:hypothetical protein
VSAQEGEALPPSPAVRASAPPGGGGGGGGSAPVSRQSSWQGAPQHGGGGGGPHGLAASMSGNHMRQSMGPPGGYGGGGGRGQQHLMPPVRTTPCLRVCCTCMWLTRALRSCVRCSKCGGRTCSRGEEWAACLCAATGHRLAAAAWCGAGETNNARRRARAARDKHTHAHNTWNNDYDERRVCPLAAQRLDAAERRIESSCFVFKTCVALRAVHWPQAWRVHMQRTA